LAYLSAAHWPERFPAKLGDEIFGNYNLSICRERAVPDFLYAPLDMTAHAAFFEESRMKCAEAATSQDIRVIAAPLAPLLLYSTYLAGNYAE
jgi:hypothetical protein